MHAHTQREKGGRQPERQREEGMEEGKNLVVKAETAMTVMSGRNRFYQNMINAEMHTC